MIGTKQLVIDASDFIKGMSSGTDISDGGFSNETDAVNLTYSPGVLYASALAVDSDTDDRLTGSIIAGCVDMNTSSPTNRLLVTDDGKAYRYNGTKLDAAGVALTAAQTWTAGLTDIVVFAGEAYVSSRASLTRWQNDNTIDAGASWPFTFTNANHPHPGIVYENNMYWADKNLLLIQSSTGDAVAPTTILTLSADQVITALGVDPGTGLMLIATTSALSISATLSLTNKLLWYDGNSTKVVKSVSIEDMILSFHSVGGTTFVGYGKNIGYINGSGITFLRKLKNVTLSNDDLPYKHRITNIADTLYVVDGKQVLAFGEVVRGQKIFYYAYSNNNSIASKFTSICNVGSGKLGLAYNTTAPSKNFDTLDTTSIATNNSMTWNSNRYHFPRPIILRSVYLEYADAVGTNDNNRSLSYKYEKIGSGFNLLRVQGQETNESIKNLTGSSIYFIDNIVGFTPDKIRMLQFRYITDTTNIGLKRIIAYYDVAE